MVDHEPKQPYEPFLMSEEDCMSFSSLVLMTILVICNIEVKQKQFFWHRETASSPLGPPKGGPISPHKVSRFGSSLFR